MGSHKPSPYWKIEQSEDENWHLKPDNDLYDHSWDDCLCGVILQEIEREEGDPMLLTVHRSLDGRESYAS